MSKEKFFKPDEHDFEIVELKVTYRDSDVGIHCGLHVTHIDGREWGGRKRQAKCEGGGYDMRGTVFAEWMRHAFPLEKQLLTVGPLAHRMTETGDDWRHIEYPHIFQMNCGKILVPKKSRLYGVVCKYNPQIKRPEDYIAYEGACGFRQMEAILYHLGYWAQWIDTKRHEPDRYWLRPVDDETYYRHDHGVLLLPEQGQLVFKLEKQALLPEGSDKWEKEELFAWVSSDKHVNHSLVTLDVGQFGAFSALLKQHLGEHYLEQEYANRDDGGMQWVSEAKNKVGWSDFPIRSMSLLVEESDVKIVKFKEID
ncbi:MAG: hypothetical protein KAS32_21285 [Candidatus Peribacteraceae bacterium]|nr:hypothetical protein [Candidatus Peribacteraceae bacterium]